MSRHIVAAVACAMLFARAAAAERLPVTLYTTANGLPHDRIKRIVRDSRGFLWFGTAAGLSRFDGERFVIYGVAHGLSHSSINDLIEARDGTYWIATNGGGVCQFRPGVVAGGDRPDGAPSSGAFTCVPLGDAVANRVNAVFEDRQGRIWAGTDGGLFRFDPAARPAGFAPVPSDLPRDNVWTIAAGADGHVWVGDAYGLARYAPDGEVWRYNPFSSSRHFNVWALMFDRDGRLWIGHNSGLVAVLPLPASKGDEHPPLWRSFERASAFPNQELPVEPGQARGWTQDDGLLTSAPGTIGQTSDGHVWIGSGVWARTAGGVNEFDGRTLRAYTADHGLSEDPIISVAEDRNGNLWLGSYATGAIRVAKTGLVAYGERDGLSSGQVFAIVRGDGRDFYTVTSGPRVHRFDGTRFIGIRPNIGEAEWPGWHHAPLIDRRGEWWIPTRNGMYRFARVSRVEELAAARPIAVYGTRTGLPGDEALAPFEDSRGDIWFGIAGRAAVVRWDRATGSFHSYGSPDGLSGVGSAIAFCEDRAGNIWAGFLDGAVARFRAGRFEVLRASEGIPAGQITALHVDDRGRLWIGSRDAIAYSSAAGGGAIGRDAELARIDDPAAARPHAFLYPPDVLMGFGVRCIGDDGGGGLYLGGDRGVQHFNPDTGSIRRYTRADGLPSEDVEIAFRNPDSGVWFGTWKGVARLRRDAVRAGATPSVLIGGLRVAGVPHPIAELGETEISGLELQPHQNQLDIAFFALAFATGQPLLYQHRLEGADADWGSPADRRSVTYVSMPPGRYRFLVRAITSDGVATNPAAISFAVLPPIWQRPWFIAGALAGVILLVTVAHRARVARLLAVERMRTSIATDLHDDIGASLSQIAILSEVVRQRRPDDAVVADPLGRIATTSRELVDAMSDIVWAINPHRDSLRDLVQRMRRFASDVLSARGIVFTFHAPADGTHLKVGADVRRHLFLIFKEAINNLARHSGATRGAIELSLGGGRLSLEIVDDGRGFDQDETEAGHGLSSMRARATAIGGTLDIAAAPAAGTRLRLEVPLGRRSRWLRRGRRDSISSGSPPPPVPPNLYPSPTGPPVPAGTAGRPARADDGRTSRSSGG